MEIPTISESNGEASKIGVLSFLTALNRFGMSLRVIVLPLFALQIGQDEAFYGLMIAVAGYVQVAALFPGGTVSDRKGRGVAILIGGLASGTSLLLLPFAGDPLTIIALYAFTGIGAGFISPSIDSLIADYTKKGGERTKTFGYTIAFATVAASVGPFLGGWILDPMAFPGIADPLVRYAIIFTIMGSLRLIAGVVGFLAEWWLIRNGTIEDIQSDEDDENMVENDSDSAKSDTQTALLFGTTQALMGFSSGMVIPYLIPWIYAAFNPDPLILGSIPAISNLTLASGTLFVGFTAERTGKLRMIGLLYLLAPILTIGIVYSWSLETMLAAMGVIAPAFLIMVFFYIIRMAVANMARPAVNSLFMGEISTSRRGRSLALTRIMWTFSRQTGTLATAFALGLFGGIVSYGILVFPIAMAFYPFCVIPMYIAVRRNKRLREQFPAD